MWSRIPHNGRGEMLDKITLAEWSKVLGKLAKGLRRGHKAASSRDWKTATGYYRLASEVLHPGGPIHRRVTDEADRMAKLADNPPEPPKPLA